MKVKCRILSFETPASDNSHVPVEVMSSYINSQACKEALANHTMIGSLTHRSRTISAVFPENSTLSKTVGKDDSMLIVSEKAPTPTHYITDLEIGNDGWLYGTFQILKEDGLDDYAVQNIRRLTGLLKQKIHIPCSAVIVGYWKNSGHGDTLTKCASLRSCDFTLNPSWAKAGVVEIIDDDQEIEKEFSEVDDEGKLHVKTFSAADSSLSGYAKSSKIDGQYTVLKAKCFSMNAEVMEVLDEPVQVEAPVVEEQREFSIASVKERLREAKFSPRVYFRKTYISYRQVARSLGSRLDDETKSILKALFTSDVLYVLQKVTPLVLSGKNFNAVLGVGALGKNVRQAAQALFMPYRMAFQEMNRQGFVSKVRYQKLQAAYLEFINALLDDVFNTSAPVPTEKEIEAAEKEHPNDEGE